MRVHPGEKLGPYEVLAPLGAGGMGEVYRARDTRLGRDVAVKVLPAEFASDPERLARFEREARAAAALNHPNILVLYDIGTHDGAPYIVTELLEGESLRQRLRGGPLSPEKAAGFGVQIAQGLAAAHEKGVVHRDLKPENLFITKDGHVKILDFGLARLLPAGRPTEGPLSELGTADAPTAAGALLGTTGYMSPEQARGLPADHRSDIFSFGAVLYELLSGRRPFGGDTTTDVLAAILKEDPPVLPPPVPAPLGRVVGRCLEKRPEDRFQSARDLAFALQELSEGSRTGPAPGGRDPVGPVVRRKGKTAVLVSVVVLLVALVAAGVWVRRSGPAGASPGTSRKPKIVVLPFENLGPPDDAYFAAGMADEITSRLANVRGLGVISRTTAAECARKSETVKQIGNELGVDYVLEGSVRWEHGAGRESRVRITPELIRVADDTNVWSERYERVLADVFAIQSEVAENTVRAMGLTLVSGERASLKTVSTADMEAYDLYLRGRERAERSDGKDDVEGAVRLFQQAVDRDPRFAEAVAGLARNKMRMAWFYGDRGRSLLLQALEEARRAVELRPDLAETHDALGWCLYQGQLDYPRALEEFAAARAIQPTNSDVLFGIACVYRRQGRWREAAEATAASVEFDPKNAVLLGNGGPTYILARRYGEADRVLAQVIELNPKWGGPYGWRAWLQVVWRGDTDKAHALMEAAGRVSGLGDDQGFIALRGFQVALSRLDYAGALRRLDAEKRPAIVNVGWYLPVPLLRGQVERLANRPDLAHRSFEAARLELEEAIRKSPDDARLHSSLGVAFAGLGLPADAVREADLGCTLTPSSKDAWISLYRIADRALVYTMVGDKQKAIADLDTLLGQCGEFTPYVFSLDPRYAPLRPDPRFQALLAKYEVKP